MPTNLFETAKVVKSTQKAKKADKNFVEMEGLELVAAIDHAIKWLTSLKDTVEGPVKDDARARFIEEGIVTGKQPESFDATEGKATGNIQCKKRASNSGLTDIEQLVCNEHNIPLGSSGGEYFFPAEHQKWVEANGAKISKALTAIKDCPAGIIAKKDTKVIATDDSIPYIFQNFKSQKDVIEKLLPMVSVVAIKPKFSAGAEEDEANESALSVIQKFLSPEQEG